MKPQATFKLRVKLAGGEFEAEGDPELVTRQFETFRALLRWPAAAERENGVDREGRRSTSEPARTARPSVISGHAFW